MLVVVATALVGSMVLSACSPSDRDRSGAGDQSQEPVFAVDPEDLGEPYTNEALGITFSPPRDWMLLEDDTRERIMEALRGEAEGAQLIDVFFSTETLSFAVLQRPTDEAGRLLSIQECDELLAATLTPGDDPAGVTASERTEFGVNNLHVIHYRHVVADRIGATLLFTGTDGDAILLQYSIPAAEIDAELRKVESSIGTLRRIR